MHRSNMEWIFKQGTLVQSATTRMETVHVMYVCKQCQGVTCIDELKERDKQDKSKNKSL